MESALGKKWALQSRIKAKNQFIKTEDIIKIVLDNRGLRSKKQIAEFLSPTHPKDISFPDLGVPRSQLGKAVARIKKAIEKKEKIVIYGDYDADGICATAILWEALFGLKADVLPYLPERFSEGYGLNAKSVQGLKLKAEGLKLIITVDNGIVANQAVKKANELGIEVIITDHHQKGRKSPVAHSILHTAQTSGSGIAWFLAREILKTFKGASFKGNLELVAIGTIADQINLLGVNRSLVKYGLEDLNKTKRVGLLSLFNEAAVKAGEISTYTVGFVIAPRINAMGRMAHAIDSLRLLCTKNVVRAGELSRLLAKTNKERQKIVEEVVFHARDLVNRSEEGFIVLAHETYHEGVIGLAASKLVEEFYRPAIVLSKGPDISKASARSIPGINIIEVVRKTGDLLLNGGGHEMAAGFSIETAKLELFNQKIRKISRDYLTPDLLQKTLKIDCELQFSQINQVLLKNLLRFEPFGMGNPQPVFETKSVEALGARLVGSDKKHLKLKVKKSGRFFDAIAFGFGEFYSRVSTSKQLDIAYSIEEDGWNRGNLLQLKLKDLKMF